MVDNDKEQEIEFKLEGISFKTKEDFDEEFDMNEKQQIHASGASTIYRMTSKKNHKNYAVRFIQLPVNNSLSETQLRDIRKVRLVRHTNVIKYYDLYSWSDEEFVFYVIKMDYCEQNLMKVLEGRISNNKKFTDIQLLWMVKQGLSVIDYLKESHLMSHHGITPSCILTTNEDGWKITGFGYSFDNQNSDQSNINTSTFVPNPYMAPEFIQTKQDKTNVVADPVKADIFSLGMVLLRCAGLLKETEIEGTNIDLSSETQAKLTKIVRGSKVACGGARKFFANIILQMTQPDFNLRINLDDLRQRLNNATIRQDLAKV